MKILFDLRRTGLGNNGGSLTLIKSANKLIQLGQTVIFIDSGANKNTWVDLDAPHIIVKNESQIPDADFIIATGYKSVEPTVAAPERCGQKAHWIRAWETWQYSEDEIYQKVLKQRTIKLVNSVCLQKKLAEHNFPSTIVYPGYDFKDFYPLNVREKTKYIILGGLYREGVHGNRKRVKWLIDAATYLKENNTNIKFYLFGSEKDPKNKIVDKYIRSPTISEKNEFYNMCHIWMAPTMSEGLHLPPAEAMLTECPVVCTDAELSGMQDYIEHYQNGIVTLNDFLSFVKGIETLIKEESFRISAGKKARDKILSIGSREENMNKLIKYLESLQVVKSEETRWKI